MSAFTIDVLQSRRMVSWGGRFITAFNQGHTRNYLYPVYTPAGQAVTDETPVDHPHHRSIWIAAEEVSGYNFYIERAYGGRTAGAIREIDASWEQLESNLLRVTQTLEWRGAPTGAIPTAASCWSKPAPPTSSPATSPTSSPFAPNSSPAAARPLRPDAWPTAPRSPASPSPAPPSRPAASPSAQPSTATTASASPTACTSPTTASSRTPKAAPTRPRSSTRPPTGSTPTAPWPSTRSPASASSRRLVRRRPLVRPRLRLPLHQHHAHAGRRDHRRATLGPDRPLRHPRRRPQRRRHRRRVPALPRRRFLIGERQQDASGDGGPVVRPRAKRCTQTVFHVKHSHLRRTGCCPP